MCSTNEGNRPRSVGILVLLTLVLARLIAGVVAVVLTWWYPNQRLLSFSISYVVRGKKTWPLYDCLGTCGDSCATPLLKLAYVHMRVHLASRLRCLPLLLKFCPYLPRMPLSLSFQQEVAGAQRIYQLLQYKADVSLVKANIAALEEREQTAERLRREAEQAAALRELAVLKKEELRLRAAVGALEAKRAAYAKAAKVQ